MSPKYPFCGDKGTKCHNVCGHRHSWAVVSREMVVGSVCHPCAEGLAHRPHLTGTMSFIPWVKKLRLGEVK